MIELLDQLKAVGVKEVWFEHLNLNSQIKERLFNYLLKADPELIPLFERANTLEYRNKLEQVIAQSMAGRNLKMGLGKVIHHHDLPKRGKNT